MKQPTVQFEGGRVHHQYMARDWDCYDMTYCGIYFRMEGKILVEVTKKKCKKCFNQPQTK